jgi:histidyl-tRNA synthetase
MSQTLQAVRGMNDILPDEAEFWELFEETIRSWLKSYGYRPIRLPIVEPTPLFKRAIGEVTDIVEKEMYSFIDSLNGEALTLRPEGTAGCVRAVIEHNLIARQPARLYYIGQMFRHERPQKGRYRQFHQVGVEAPGYAGPDIDAEMILMGARLWADLGLDGIELQINSLGQPEERAQHRAALVAYFEENAELLDEDAKRRLYTNPLRILDTKNPALQDLCGAAPKLIDFLGAESLLHFEGVQRVLRDAGLPYKINPRLVRGLDYYNLTVFEWVTAMGIERLIALIKDAGGEPAGPAPDVYLVHQGDAASRLAFRVAEGLRDQGIDVLLHCGGGSFKSQMKKADGSGATFAVIIGDDEAATGEVQLKPLREEGAAQLKLKVDDLAEAIIGQLIDSDEEE